MAERDNKNKVIQTISHNGQTLAHVFRSNLEAEGVKFLTPPEYTLQLGLLEHAKGKVLKDHRHNPDIEYEVDTTQEFLYIERGRLKVSYFTDDFEKVTELELGKGDFMLHVSGGHGFEVLEDCRIIEIKQGPFPGDKLAKIYPK